MVAMNDYRAGYERSAAYLAGFEGWLGERMETLKTRQQFPMLDYKPFRIIGSGFGGLELDYNCFAFAFGEYENGRRIALWSGTAPTWRELNALLTKQGYKRLSREEEAASDRASGHVEGYQRLAVYFDGNGVPSHAAVEDPWTGVWRSKLGPLPLIQHDRLFQLFGDVGPSAYGYSVMIFRRRARTTVPH
jgi:hypothetical protein